MSILFFTHHRFFLLPEKEEKRIRERERIFIVLFALYQRARKITDGTRNFIIKMYVSGRGTRTRLQAILDRSK